MKNTKGAVRRTHFQVRSEAHDTYIVLCAAALTRILFCQLNPTPRAKLNFNKGTSSVMYRNSVVLCLFMESYNRVRVNVFSLSVKGQIVSHFNAAVSAYFYFGLFNLLSQIPVSNSLVLGH